MTAGCRTTRQAGLDAFMERGNAYPAAGAESMPRLLRRQLLQELLQIRLQALQDFRR
jgi:hypothetical protein